MFSVIDLTSMNTAKHKKNICKMNTKNKQGDGTYCFVSKFSSKRNCICTRVAYLVPEVHDLVARRLYPRR